MAALVACRSCGLVHGTAEGEAPPAGGAWGCARCGAVMGRSGRRGRLSVVAALSVAALALYVPANLLPILRMERYGIASDSTVWDASAALFEDGDWFIGSVVFAASVLVPLLKLMGLFWLVAAAKFKWVAGQVARGRVYRVIEVIGPWAMLDIFVLAVLVSLVKLQRLATVVPGPGAVAFVGVVVCTMVASAAFDPRVIWEQEETDK